MKQTMKPKEATSASPSSVNGSFYTAEGLPAAQLWTGDRRVWIAGAVLGFSLVMGLLAAILIPGYSHPWRWLFDLEVDTLVFWGVYALTTIGILRRSGPVVTDDVGVKVLSRGSPWTEQWDGVKAVALIRRVGVSSLTISGRSCIKLSLFGYPATKREQLIATIVNRAHLVRGGRDRYIRPG